MAIEIPSAPATGFAESDLTRVTIDPAVLSGGEFLLRVEPGRASAMCPGASGLVAVDILIGSGDAGTERRYRRGETTIDELERICRQRNPSCRMKAIEAGAAVGWQSIFELGDGMCSTAMLVRDGRMLTVRSLAPDAALAEANADAVVGAVGPQVVGARPA